MKVTDAPTGDAKDTKDTRDTKDPKDAKDAKDPKDGSSGDGARTITATPEIDPRLRARRIQVKREAGRRRLLWGVVLGVVVALLVAALVVARSPLLAVDRVEVSGAVYSDPAAIQAIVRRETGSPMLAVDTGKVERAFEAIPWVERAEVRREWPHTLRVDLKERTPQATYYASDGQYRVVDLQGRVIVALAGDPVDVLHLGGVGPAVAPGGVVPEPYLGATQVAVSLPEDLRARTRDIAIAADGQLSLRLNPSGEVLLGPPTDLRAKLLAVLAVFTKVDPATISTLDVRVPDKPVLTQGKG